VKKINIKGAIIPNDDKWIYELFEYDHTCPNDVMNVLNELNGEPVQVTINSGGGSVYDASEIYAELKDYPGNVEVRIVGLAASAASVISMAGDTVRISPTAEIMIHNAAMLAWGDHKDMDKASEMLKITNKSVSAAYRHKTGLSEDELLSLMEEETWMTAEIAKEKGFVDEIMFDNTKAQMVASAPGALPQQVVNKIRADKMKQPQTVTMDEIQVLMNDMKTQIVNELNEPKEPEQKTAKANLSRLFLNL